MKFASRTTDSPPFDAAATVRAAEGLAGAAGLEPTTCGFGDRRSTN